MNINTKEIGLLCAMIVRDEHAAKALLTPKKERSHYQKALVKLWNRLADSSSENS